MLKVFIADDSQVFRSRLVEMLSDFRGIEIIGQARDAIEASKLLEQLRPDVIILDIRMPGGSGIDVLRNIKKDVNNPKIIMLTNYSYPVYREKCKGLGADFFFDKSTEMDKFTEVFESLIRNSNSS